MENNLNKFKTFLGTGWGFPPTFDKALRKVGLLAGVEDIHSSLEILLSTALGERVMRSDYGSNLDKYIFDPIDENLKSLLKKIITDAIYLYEPRITPDQVGLTAEPEEGRVMIEVSFTVKATNSRSNIVFPYYLIEGTNLI